MIDSEKCSSGFFFYNNECIKCPSESAWNKTHCVIRKKTKTITTKTKEVGLEPVNKYGSTLSGNALSSTSTVFDWAQSSSSTTGSSSSSEESSSSGSSGTTLTVGEEMKRQGLDYDSMKKRWQSEGWFGNVKTGDSANLVVEPIVEKRHHLRSIHMVGSSH